MHTINHCSDDVGLKPQLSYSEKPNFEASLNFSDMRSFINSILLVLLCVGIAQAQVNLNTGLLAHLPLNGNGNDVSGSNNSVTLSSTGVYPSRGITGIPNEAMLFNGAVEQGQGSFPGSILNNLNACALSFWFNVSSITNGMSLVGQDNILEAGFYTGPNRIIVFHPTSGSTSYNLSVATNQWVHVAINTSSTGMQVYLNGVLAGSQNGNHTLGNNTTPTRIGGNVVNTSNNSFLRGALDEVRIYNRTLSTDEINVLSAAVGVTLSTGNPTSSAFCAGANINVPYTVSGTGIQPGNVFTAQLSEPSGSFANPTTIGSLNATASGNISASLPGNLETGSNYKIRVVASQSPVIGQENTATLSISNPTEGLSTLSRGRILHYQFNNNTNDSSPSAANATANGGFSYVNDRFGNANSAIRLNGTNAFVDVPDGTWFNGAYSTSCWVRPEAFGTFARIYDFANGQANDNVLACLTQGTNGRLAAENYVGNVSGVRLDAPVGAPLNQWSHVAITYNGTVLRIFLNGNLIATGNSTGPRLITRTLNYIGRSNWAADAFAQSAFDDFMVWNRVITDSEISTLASDGLIDSNSPVCAGSALQLIGPSIPGAQYTWSGPGGFSATGVQVLRSPVTTAQSGNYSLNINVNGCTSGAQTAAVQVIDNPTPPTVTISGLPATTNTLANPNTMSGTPAGGYFSGIGVSGNTFNPGISGEGNFIVLYNVQGNAACVTTASDTISVGASFTMQNGTVNACAGGFFDSGGPNNPYNANEDFTQTFCSSNGERLRFTFSAMSLGTGDTLWAYDGNSANAPLLRMYIPFSTADVIWSSGTCITFRWKSNGSAQTTGWQSQFSCLANPEQALNIAMNAGISVVCNATILDPQGGSPYSQGFTRHTFKSTNGQRLRFQYSTFAINGNNGGHWLRIYDGPNQSFPLIGQYNNFNFIPAVIQSTGEFLTFEFDATNTNAGFGGNAGFVGALSCFGQSLETYNLSSGTINTCSGVFYDDGGPNQPFSPNQDRTQTFCSDNGEHIQFRFNNNVNLADSGDTLWVYDGADVNNILLGYYIQGSSIERLTSSGTCLTFRFKTNASTEPGWQGFIQCVSQFPVQDTINISSGLRAVCNAIVSDNSGPFAYGQGFNRQTYRSINGQRLRFTYSLFNINGNNGGHWLRIYDGPDQTYPLIGQYNNFNFIPANVESTGEYLTFEFDRTNTNAGFGSAQGYSGLMTCFGEALPVLTIGNGTLNVCEGVFYDDGGPNQNYSANGNYTQTFCSASGQLIQLLFNRNETSFGSGDTLWVFDGNSINAPPLAMYISGSTIEPLTSTGTCLTFRYRSNASNQARGWQGIISCVDSPPAVIQYAMSSGIRYVCNGIFRDPGGTGNYPAGTWEQTFTSYNGERLRAAVNSININGNNGGHWLRVYDGPSTASPLIGSYNNFNGWPPAFQSTGSSLTFRFESTNQFAGLTAGFEIEFSCFSELPIDVAWLSSPVCRGANLNIPFTLNTPVNAGNTFTAQLSDANGNFGSPVNIGTLSGTTAGTINATIPIGTAAGTSYRVRIISSDPVQIGSISPNTLVINPTPEQPASINSSNGLNFCAGNNTTLSIAPQNAVSYQWLLDGAEVGGNNPQFVASEAGVYTIRLENNCGSIVSNASATLSIQPQPSAALIEGPSSITLCDGSSTTLSVAPQPGVSYAWTRDGNATGDNSATLGVNQEGVYAVSLSNACGSVASLNSITISTENAPVLSLVSTTPVGCSGAQNGAIDVSVQGASTLLWSNGATTEDLNGVGAGDYQLLATSVGGCESTLNVTLIGSAPILAEAEIMPQVGASPNGSIDLTITGGLPPFTVSWSNGSTEQDISQLATGTYTVTITDANNCTQSFEFIVDVLTGIAFNMAQIEVFPNPAADFFVLRSAMPGFWQLHDIGGRQILQGEHLNGDQIISVSNLPKGLYLLHFQSQSQQRSVVKIMH